MLWPQLEIKSYLFIRSQTVTGAGPLITLSPHH